MNCINICIDAIQANDYNVVISCDGAGEKAVNTMGLTLLDSQLAHKAVSKYRAPSLNQDTAKMSAN